MRAMSFSAWLTGSPNNSSSCARMLSLVKLSMMLQSARKMGTFTKLGVKAPCDRGPRLTTLFDCGGPAAVSGDDKKEDNSTPAVNVPSAPASSNSLVKCTSLDWDSSSGDDGTYQVTKSQGQWQSTPWVSSSPAPPPPPVRSSTPTTPPVFTCHPTTGFFFGGTRVVQGVPRSVRQMHCPMFFRFLWRGFRGIPGPPDGSLFVAWLAQIG